MPGNLSVHRKDALTKQFGFKEDLFLDFAH